ncbi:glycosyltransferase family 2 protein [Natrialbaceae archaeon AArc-T1-2]|uniref:glycosyltransferase family 2 protein n=1 Tax=Natrialbaceae archaeon AArc-T1-2 TaxID=3053904 RepID=UPI00255AC33D|nr:glycosyltransferase family 2 protein [Natrialbaceae archaeon AArc-T1-2]WIV67431.1 glycosyltransferase family 2 protein [Natrialbaceae archaeon AArc-T1-2]
MYRGSTVGVVMPAYNEAGFVGDVVREMPDYVDRIYAIDDRSTDDTWNEIHEAAREDATAVDRHHGEDVGPLVSDGGTSSLASRAAVSDPIGRVVPIQHRENRGAGGAIKTGYLAAREDGMDVTVTVDADGQMDLTQMSRLLDPIVEGEADYAKGNRLLSKEYRAAMPRFRFVGNATLTFLTKIAAGYWKTMDPQNGYTAISHDALEAIDLENLYEYYGYCNDLLVKLNVHGMRVADVAMPAVYGEETSSIQYTQYVPKVSAMLLRNFLWRLKTKYLVVDFHPLALFYLVGAATAAVSVLGAGLALIGTISGVGLPSVQGSTSLLLFVAGVVLLLFAMVFDMAESEHLETRVQ